MSEICPHCRNLDFKGLTGYIQSAWKVRLSGATGCTTCSIISQGFEAFDPHWNNEEERIGKRLFFLPTDRGALRVKPDVFARDGRNIPELEFYSFKENPTPWPFIGAATHLSEDFSLGSRLLLAKKWLDVCLAASGEFTHTSGVPLPSRVLDILGQPFNQDIKLLDSRGLKGKYACLSHCWGKEQPLKTTTKNITDMMSKIRWSSLPRTFQDAIHVARGLDIRYIWIDSLCIIQDNEDDWSREAVKMASVYGAAHLTICATRASDSHAGFLQPCARKHFVEVTSSSEDGSSTHRVYVRPPLPHKPFLLNGDQNNKLHPLKSRAWAFQEHFLSPRLLQFGHFEMVWECSHGLQCECGTLNKKGPFSKPNNYEEKGLKGWSRHVLNTGGSSKSTSFGDFWMEFIRAYSHMQLTFEKDRLVAIVGIVESMRPFLDADYYFAGHWTRGLRGSLLWECVPGELAKKVISYDVPSWSWASVQAQKYYMWLNQSESFIFNVQDNGFSRGMGTITLSGYCFVATMMARPEKPGTRFVEMQGDVFSLDLDYVVDENGKRLIDSQTCEVYCLVLGNLGGCLRMMVLQEVNHGTAAQAFRRIGITNPYLSEGPIKGAFANGSLGTIADTRAFCVI